MQAYRLTAPGMPTIDCDYDPRLTVEGVDSMLRTLAALGNAASARLEHRTEQYGLGAAEQIRVFPALDGAPVHIFFHGGFWRSGSPEMYSFVAPPLVARGICTFIVGYALCPEVTINEIVRQGRAALRWVQANARTFGGNPRNVTLSGHSSGAHIAAMVLSGEDSTGPAGVRAATLASGIFDLAPLRSSWLQPVLQLDEETVARNRPLDLPVPTTPLQIAVGAAETNAFKRQSQTYAAYVDAQGGKAAYREIAGHNHVSLLLELAEGGPLLDTIARKAWRR